MSDQKPAATTAALHFGPYRSVKEIGRGGMGVVYQGVHAATGEEVALKTVLDVSGGKLAAIRREIQSLRRVRHPGIVRVLDDGVTDGLPWVAMPLLRGRTLRAHLDSLWRGPDGRRAAAHGATDSFDELPTAAPGSSATPAESTPLRPLLPILTLMRRLCEPLAFLHGEGLVHRDLKPDNIFLREDDRPILVDLGIAAHFGGAGREELEVTSVAGSVHYMAPEQIRGELVDARADLYALGCILYECVTGRPPFSGGTAQSIWDQHLNACPISPSVRVPGVPRELDQLILQLLQKRPQDRRGYAADVAAALGALGAEVDPERGPAPRTYLVRPDLWGRADAVAALTAALDRVVAQRRGGLVLVRGESGVGKTRLAMEVAQSASQRQVTVITGTCVAPGAGEAGATTAVAGPLHPIRPLLIAAADHARRSREEADRLFGPRGRILADYEPALRDLPGQDQQPAPAPLPPELARERVIASLRETLGALAAGARLFVVLDDLQWADDLTLSLLEALARSGLDDRGILFVATYRAEETRPEIVALERMTGVVTVPLARLDGPSIAAMVMGMLAGNAPPLAALDVLYRHSNGNPFFVTTYLRAAIDEGILRRDESGSFCFRARRDAASIASLPLPNTLADLLERRLAQLDTDGRALVEWAAVLGQELDDDLLLAGPLDDGLATMRALDDLRARQILEEVNARGLRFVQDKIREIAYARITEATRIVLHRRAAEALEERHPEASSLAPSLGHHFARAGIHERAGHYFIMAAKRAREVYANGDAIRFFRSAIDALTRARAGHAEIAALYEHLGDVLALVGLQEEARSAYLGALTSTSAHPMLTEARLVRKMGKTWEMHHEHVEALGCYAQAEAALGGPGASAAMSEAPDSHDEGWWREWLLIQHDRISAYYWLADVERLDALVKAVRPVVELRGTTLDRGSYLHALSQRNVQMERYVASVETVRCARACVEAFAASGGPADGHDILAARASLAIILLLHGDLDEAETQMTEALLAGRRTGDLEVQSRCLTYLTVIHRRRRCVGPARDMAQKSLSLAREKGVIEYIGAAHANRAWVALMDRDLAGAEAAGREALSCWEAQPRHVYPFQWLARLPLTATALAHNRFEDAVAEARVLLDDRQQRLTEQLEAALTAAVAASAQGQRARARKALSLSLRVARRAGYL